MDKSVEFLDKILDLGSDWSVLDIRINKAKKELDIFVEYTKYQGKSPLSEKLYPIYDLNKMRRIRHANILDYATYLNVRIPRVINEKGEVYQIELGWADSRVSFSKMFENEVIEILLISKNQTKSAEYFGISFEVIHNIMKRSVHRGLERRSLTDIKALSLDEKSYGSGQTYFTVLSDPIRKRVLDIIDGRTTEDTVELLETTLSRSELDKVSLVSMDMWEPFMNAAEESLPNASIIHDKFHVAKYLNEAVNAVRRGEVRKYEQLKNTRYLFLKNSENWTEQQAIKFSEIKEINTQTAQAWQIKENFKGIYNQPTKHKCLSFFLEWYEDVLDASIYRMEKVADMLGNHLNGIVNAAVYDMSNSVAENLNGQIQIIKSIARGFKNFDGYRNFVLFFQGKLNLLSL